jgi:hypothetical protein
LYIFPKDGELWQKAAVHRGARAEAATATRAEASEHERQPLSRCKTSSEPSVCPDFTRFELEQLPEPMGGTSAPLELVLQGRAKPAHFI